MVNNTHNHDSYVNLAILNMVHNSIHDGKIERLMEIGFTREQLNAIKGLSYSQIIHIASTRTLFVNMSINPHIFETILQRCVENEELNKTIDKAVSLGASIEILGAYFGLSISDVSSTRKLLNLPVTKGRSRKPTEEETEIIWKQWDSKLKANPNLVIPDNKERLYAYMDITQHVSMFNDGNDPLSLTSVANEIESSFDTTNE